MTGGWRLEAMTESLDHTSLLFLRIVRVPAFYHRLFVLLSPPLGHKDHMRVPLRAQSVTRTLIPRPAPRSPSSWMQVAKPVFGNPFAF